MTETEILLQLWADTLADVQTDKAFMQQVERAAQDVAFRVRAEAVRGRSPATHSENWSLTREGVTPCNTN